jgi:hypothetical protein
MLPCSPTPLLATPALLPFAALAQTDSPAALLQQVAAQIDMIEEPDQKGNISTCVEVLASLRFDNLVAVSLGATPQEIGIAIALRRGRY